VEVFDDGSMLISDDDGATVQRVKFSAEQAKKLAEYLHSRYLSE